MRNWGRQRPRGIVTRTKNALFDRALFSCSRCNRSCGCGPDISSKHNCSVLPSHLVFCCRAEQVSLWQVQMGSRLSWVSTETAAGIRGVTDTCTQAWVLISCSAPGWQWPQPCSFLVFLSPLLSLSKLVFGSAVVEFYIQTWLASRIGVEFFVIREAARISEFKLVIRVTLFPSYRL